MKQRKAAELSEVTTEMIAAGGRIAEEVMLQPRMAVRYGTFRICVLRTSHLEPYRTNVPYPYHYKKSVPYHRTVLLSKN